MKHNYRNIEMVSISTDAYLKIEKKVNENFRTSVGGGGLKYLKNHELVRLILHNNVEANKIVELGVRMAFETCEIYTDRIIEKLNEEHKKELHNIHNPAIEIRSSQKASSMFSSYKNELDEFSKAKDQLNRERMEIEIEKLKLEKEKLQMKYENLIKEKHEKLDEVIMKIEADNTQIIDELAEKKANEIVKKLGFKK